MFDVPLVITHRTRRKARRHLMCGKGESVHSLCGMRELSAIKRDACQTRHPADITCAICKDRAKAIVRKCANAENIDLLKPGSIAILSDLLLERARPCDLFHRRLVMIYEELGHE